MPHSSLTPQVWSFVQLLLPHLNQGPRVGVSFDLFLLFDVHIGRNCFLFAGVPMRRVRAAFSYEPQNNDELKLSVNDIIEVLSEVRN